jgi:hypothetical protein
LLDCLSLSIIADNLAERCRDGHGRSVAPKRQIPSLITYSIFPTRKTHQTFTMLSTRNALFKEIWMKGRETSGVE